MDQMTKEPLNAPDQAKARSKACKRPSLGISAADRAAGHRLEMQLRRARQLSRRPGFTPIRNRRISDAIEAQTAVIMLAALAMKQTITAADAQGQAIRHVAAQLPKEARVRGRRTAKPSKSDNPAYRKPILATAQFIGKLGR